MKTTKFFIIALIYGAVNYANAQGLHSSNLSESTAMMVVDLEENEEESAVAIGTKSNYKWEFASFIPMSFDESTIEKSEDHEFGEKIACLKVLMDKYYISKEEVVPGDPMRRTIIKKPTVYNTVNRIEKFLKKEVKKGGMDVHSAESQLAYVLEVAIAVVDTGNTDSFEEAIKNSKRDASAQLALFGQVKLNKFY